MFAAKDKAGADDGAVASVRSATPFALLDDADKAKAGGSAAAAATAAAATPGGGGLPAALATALAGPKTIGRFTLTPCGGTVEPGQTVVVDVAFDCAGGPAHHKAQVAVLVSGAGPMEP